VIVIIDYGMGNLRSVLNKMNRLGLEAVLSSDPAVIASAGKLILPGVGHFAHGMHNLAKLGLIETLNRKVLVEKTPVLGICLGMQLFTGFSEEGDAGGLGWIAGRTRRMNLSGDKLKVPHMGWNTLQDMKASALFENIGPEDMFYFVHSYHAECANPADVLASTGYGITFTSVIRKDNIIGMQFHPEKSHDSGEQILKNFFKYF
jgi:imidazole glycerol-phosphate synthase subunit HisH